MYHIMYTSATRFLIGSDDARFLGLCPNRLGYGINHLSTGRYPAYQWAVRADRTRANGLRSDIVQTRVRGKEFGRAALRAALYSLRSRSLKKSPPIRVTIALADPRFAVRASPLKRRCSPNPENIRLCRAALCWRRGGETTAAVFSPTSR